MMIRWLRAACGGLALLLSASLGGPTAHALGEEPKPGESVTQYLNPELLKLVFPGGDRSGAVGGTPPAAPVFAGERQVGYLFSSWDVTHSKGFSNRPFVLLVGLDLKGHITGVRLVHHVEPIAILGLKDEAFHRFTESYKGLDINRGVDVVSELSSSVLGPGSFSQRLGPGQTASMKVDAVSRATTSAVLMSDAIVRGARIVARSRGIIAAPAAGKARLDIDRFAPADWPTLVAEGAVAHLHLTYDEARAKVKESGAQKLTAASPAARPADPFIDLYAALVTPAGIGINLLDETWYGQYTAGRAIDDQLLLIAGSGPYSFLSDDWEHADAIERIELVQGEKTIRLSGRQIKTLPFLHAKSAPDLTERALVFLTGDGALDPSRPWTLRLLVGGEGTDGQKTFAAFDLAYRLPEKYILPPSPVAAGKSDADVASPEGLGWQAIWSAHWARITILGVALIALTLILSFQARISRNRRLHRWLRIGFLSWTLVWLGWYAGAQLTVVNVITYLHTAVTDFRWDYVLADPLVAILSVFTVAGLFFWGRAAFCGWLCPFGALQELTNKLARRLGVGQLTIPAAADRQLAIVKYALFLGLVGASFLSWDLAMTGTEIEPFKAAIILRFVTEWPMVAYAVVLLAAGLFVERFYCRFACPLGGGLALLGHVRLFDTLKRHSECGRCHLCESVCPVGAIKRSGKIDMSQCFYCLDCQVMYYDEHICPPLVRQRKQREAA